MSSDLPDPGIEPGSPALQADALPSEPLSIKILLYGFLLLFYGSMFIVILLCLLFISSMALFSK